ncbi:MAG: PilZ domain-containing protein [Candidatus Omnitrophota bacterium]
MVEQRRYPRYAVPFKIGYSSPGTNGALSPTVAVNVSRTGIRMPVSDNIKIRDRLHIEIDLLDKNRPVKAVGRVVWVRNNGVTGLTAGIRITKLGFIDSSRLLAALLRSKPLV